jgi:taurine dioxygenase
MTTSIATPVTLDIAPLSGTIGAEIRRVDLHQALEPSTVAGLRQALLDYKVIFFPGQHLSPAEHKEFASYFGEITNAHPVMPGIDEHREVFEIDYTKAREMYGDQKSSRAERSEYETSDKWHTDVTFVETPPLGSILNAIVIPEAGGDTLWADTHGRA